MLKSNNIDIIDDNASKNLKNKYNGLSDTSRFFKSSLPNST